MAGGLGGGVRFYEAPRSRSLVALLLLRLAQRSGGLYDPVHHIESARIYGNIDAFAYYYVDLIIGTPPQRVSVIVDTGSGVTAFPCRSCRHCGHHIDPNFDFDRSSSAKWTSCGAGCHSQCREGHCSYHQGYTEGSSITGWYFQDQVRLGDAIQRNPPVRVSMGCHQDENRLFYTQKANGIMGIRPPGHGSPTILDQLFGDKEHIDSKVFSLCLAEWGGRIVVGGYNASYHRGSIQYVPLSAGSGYYHVPLTSMVLDGKTLSTRYGTAMIDSGTTYTYMGSEPYKALRSAIEGYCRSHSGCGATQRATCWEAPNGLSKFPTVGVWFHQVKTNWVPKAYLYRKGSTSRWCYAFEDDGPRANTVLGASWMMHQEIIFDMRTSKVGIVPAACPEFKSRPEHNARQDLTVPTAPPARQSTPAQTPAFEAAPPAEPAAWLPNAEGGDTSPPVRAASPPPAAPPPLARGKFEGGGDSGGGGGSGRGGGGISTMFFIASGGVIAAAALLGAALAVRHGHQLQKDSAGDKVSQSGRRNSKTIPEIVGNVEDGAAEEQQKQQMHNGENFSPKAFEQTELLSTQTK